jgi:Leucine-rich repeat (LRR) protein
MAPLKNPSILETPGERKLMLSTDYFPVVPPGLANLINLEILNLFNNQIEELPTSLSSMPKLRILNVG